MKKRILAIILAVAIILSICVVPASAAVGNPECDIPIITISGDGESIENADGEEVFKISKPKALLKRWIKDEGGVDWDQILADLKAVFVPYYLEGCILGPFGNYDKYYQAIYDILSDCFGEVLLDTNGNPQYGTNVSLYRRTLMENNYVNHETYHTEDYQFFYDWRLDPMEIADQLNTHIKRVKAVTGYEKVGIICRCLGANVFFAYVTKYGLDDICGVGMDGVVVNGAELVGKAVCGEFDLDINAVSRVLHDLDGCNRASVSDSVMEAVDAVAESGVVEPIWRYVKFMHWNTVVKGVTSSMALGTFFTFPGYWGAVQAEDYEKTKEYIFGPEGSEKRQEWAGLIEKLDNYDKNVRQRIPEILEEINENCNLAIISKYGLQCAPITTCKDMVGDQIVSVNRASFGATTGTIKETLSDEYIIKRNAEGKGRYISPDKLIDASTCTYPDQTWFVKGVTHSDWSYPEMDILAKVIAADTQLTVDTLQGYSRFNVVKYDMYNQPTICYAMTEENCHTENWTIQEYETTSNPVIKIKSFVSGVGKLIKIVKELAN